MTASEKGIFEELDEAEAEKQKAEAGRQKTENAIRSVMATEQGRRFIWWLLSFTGVDESVTRLDPARMMHDSAQRDVGLHVRESIEELGLFEALSKMRKENAN